MSDCDFYLNCGVRLSGGSAMCRDCSFNRDGEHRSRLDTGKVDPFRLARLLAEKKESDRRSLIPRVGFCPVCQKPSLFYNSRDDQFECMAIGCEYSQDGLSHMKGNNNDK